MRKTLSLLLVLATLSTFTAHADLLVKNARIVDPAGRTVTDGHLRIANGRIAEVLISEPENFTGETIDVAGKWVIPGLKDMHAHSWGESLPNGKSRLLGTEDAVRPMLYAGVTAMLDLGSIEDYIFELRRMQKNGAVPGAEILAAGPIVTCTNGHGTEYGSPARTIDTPAQARTQILELARKKPDVVKLVYDHARNFPSMNEPTMRSAIETARLQGLRTVVHIGTWQDAAEAALAGATAITHLHETDIPDDLARLFAERGTYVIPTMAVQADLALMERDPSLLFAPLLTELVPASILSTVRDLSSWNAMATSIVQWQRSSYESYNRTLKTLRNRRVRILTGTDVGNAGVFLGYSVHRELELLTKAGYSNWEALEATTTLPGKFLDRRWGMRPGDEANLVILEASPLDDIRNTQRISAVIREGVSIDRARLFER